MQDSQDLALVIESHIPLVVLETHDESHARQLLARVALRLGKPLQTWSITEGLQDGLLESGVSQGSEAQEPHELLQAIKQNPCGSVYALFDFHPYLHGKPDIVRHIKDIALAYGRLSHTLVLVSHELELPAEIRRFSARFDISLPGPSGLANILREEIRAWMAHNEGQRPTVDADALQDLLNNLRGVSGYDARRILRSALCDDGAISNDDLDRANRAKFELLDLNGVMQFESAGVSLDSIAGLDNLKYWLEHREAPFLNTAEEASRDRPRGLMLTGVQGSGKSLAAKAVAGSWRLPLLRLDMGALYNKYIGESEKNLRKCLQQSAQMAPCVLWLDEIEKGLSTAHDDSATSQRLLGTLLTWLAERDSAVFLVMTANDISQLPPELLRKGRLDEIFFVDLPLPHIREDIFRIHLEQRGCDPKHFDLTLLAERSEHFSGAEIEQAVVAALHIALGRELPVSTEQLLEEMDRTRPLAVTMSEQIDALRHWAQDRTAKA